MTTFTKVAITLPTQTYRAVERTRRRLKKTRSAVVAAALEHWLKHLELAEADRRYARGYLRHPETKAEKIETEAVATAVVSGWGTWEPSASSRAGERRTPARRRR